MNSGVALVTDSSSQLTPELAARFDARVVPITVTIDGHDHLEGVDLTADDFYLRLASSGSSLDLTTTQPSAAAFARVFEEAVTDGWTDVLAVIVGSSYSGAYNAAELAARTVADRHTGVVIDVVDSGTASFGVGAAVWAAADVIAAGGDRRTARRAAVERAAATSSVFVIEGLSLARRSGRFDSVDLGSEPPAGTEDVAVLASSPAGLEVLGAATDAGDAIDLMVEFLTSSGGPVAVAVGWAAPTVADVTAEFRRRLAAEPTIVELVDYRVGPSIAVHTGPETVGAFVFPV